MLMTHIFSVPVRLQTSAHSLQVNDCVNFVATGRARTVSASQRQQDQIPAVVYNLWSPASPAHVSADDRSPPHDAVVNS
jgi:hypothetical protein